MELTISAAITIVAVYAIGFMVGKYISQPPTEAESLVLRIHQELELALTNDDRALRNGVIRVQAAIKELL